MERNKNESDLVVIGGGAAGIFGAINFALSNPGKQIILLEKATRLLQKVKISGGGRCNVTHACFDPRELVLHYPRGQKELLGPFNRFACGDMMGWLEDRGVSLKIEDDGRIFPVTDDSQTIIDCFMSEVDRLPISIIHEGVTSIQKEENSFTVQTKDGHYKAPALLVATGSSKQFWQHLESIGIQMTSPVPSLFTFNIKHAILTDLPGIAFPNAEASIPSLNHSAHGPLLITHWGLSGPAILKSSAVCARSLYDLDYKFVVRINWIGMEAEDTKQLIQDQRKNRGAQKVHHQNPFELPKRFWHRLLELCNIESNWADLKKDQINQLVDLLSRCDLPVDGKSTFKEEFVTAGGVDLSEVDFRRMEHKRISSLYFAGEVLDIDAVTGGFNFQAAWTTSWIAAESIEN